MAASTGEFLGTKRDLEALRRQRRGTMSVMPRYRTLDMDHTVWVNQHGVVHIAGPNGGKMNVVVAQCLPLAHPMQASSQKK